MAIPKNWEQWAKTLISGIISGAAGAILSSAGAAVVGKPLDWKQVGAVATSGAFMSAVMYLKQSPLPPDAVVETSSVTVTSTKEQINK